MPAWVALLGTLGLNYRRHKRGRQTMCAFTRAHVPPLLFEVLYDAGSDYLRGHVLGGYIKETP